MFWDVLYDIDRKIYLNEDFLSPKHGSGATADRLVGNEKWVFTEWTERLEVLFPFVEYGLPSLRFWDELHPDGEACSIRFLSPEEERPVKMVAVPKTHLTPRLIAEEPTCMQYMQQALLRPVVDGIERDRLAGSFVGFKHQWPNQAMACIGSEDGSLATLDLSEASDRVGNWMVEELFGDFPHFLEALQATRSTRVQLIGGEILTLGKFASMGSAMTFPVEAMVFTSIVIEAVLRFRTARISKATIGRLRDTVRVYGDDIVVPTETAEFVIDSLEAFGLKVNQHKSFWNGEFRESCGKEYWNGFDVSLVRFRKAAPASRRDTESIVSWVEMRNLFEEAGIFDRTVRLLDDDLESLLGYFPYVGPTSTLLGRIHPLGYYQVDRIEETKAQRPLTKGYVLRETLRKQPLDGHPALLKCLLTTIGMQDVDEKHLQRGGRPLAVSMKLGLAQPF